MSQAEAETQEQRVEALHKRLAENALGGHWQPRERQPALVPHVWPWPIVYECLMESGEVIKLGH
ncbi:MAG: hypothetical protein O7A66_00975, partial [Alphaproteobacteria bacterium]|nr:hypothetical protein [Alphaproteobacteria bacterium]